jgi:hypothetical protein
MEVKPIATKSLNGACKVFLQDLEALPEEAFLQSFGGKARTVADIVHEVNLVNDHIGLTVRGEELFVWPEGWIKAPETLKSKQDVIDAFKASSEKIMATMEGYSEEDFHTPIQSDGSETNRFERCRFMALHLWYHSGQLNFIQTMLGDDVWHWK